MQQFANCTWVPAHKARYANCCMSGTPSHEMKDAPRNGIGCEADAKEGACPPRWE